MTACPRCQAAVDGPLILGFFSAEIRRAVVYFEKGTDPNLVKGLQAEFDELWAWVLSVEPSS